MAKGNAFKAVYYADRHNTSENKNKNIAEAEKSGNKKTYPETLDIVRKDISKNHANDLADVISKEDGQTILKKYISQYLHLENILCIDEPNYDKLIERIYEDMVEFGFLTKYIYNEDVEEININSWNDVEVIDSECVSKRYRN